MQKNQHKGGNMKHFVQNLILVILLTILLLFSYAFVQKKTEKFGFSEFYQFLMNHESGQNNERAGEKDDAPAAEKQNSTYRAVWLSYLEFNAYRRSVEQNNEKNFQKFFRRVLNRSKKCGLNRVIVQVRPFGDALYESGYFPWAACISGTQGTDPGYDPLAVMVELAHKKGFQIEAWINPYRVSSGSDLDVLSTDNPAKVWAFSDDKTRNVLSYDGALYYNPSSQEVQELIINGVKEIVENYEVDGIHMDDYFYPTFTESNVNSAFDSLEYQKGLSAGAIEKTLTLADWRRQNVNTLVSAIYQAIKSANADVTFGISPAGNLDNLRSDLQYYVDVDTWVKSEGYIDYVMPQIYWGYTNKEAPFDEILKEWVELAEGSDVKLYVGLQMYRLGTSDDGQSDYQELQDGALIQKEITQLEHTPAVGGYCLFSYQYLDADNKTYDYDSNEFDAKRKKILKETVKHLMEGKK